MRWLVPVLALLAAPLAAQPDDSPIQAGADALLFQIGPDFEIDSFTGSIISYKWHQSSTRARRIGVSGYFDVGVEDREQNTGVAGQNQEVNFQVASVGANFVPLTYRRGDTPVYLYHGFGPTATAFFRRYETDTESGSDQTGSGSIENQAEVHAGLAGVVGVEWPVSEAISLVGEYGATLTGRYSQSRRTYRSPPGDPESAQAGDSSTRLSVGLSQTGARFGVSVYF